MLNELHDHQQSDEVVSGVSITIDIETRSSDTDELVHKVYRFGYAEEWDKWMFQEYREQRTQDVNSVYNRSWKQSRHIMWNDVNEVATIDVPPEVANKLQEATGADSVIIQIPAGGIDENNYREVCVGENA